VNTNGWAIPPRSDKTDINDCFLPEATSNWPAFVWQHRRQLDDAQELEKWLDLIFGFASRGEAALEALNVFYPCTYGLPCSVFPAESDAFFTMKRNYGQVPTQLFFERHPPRDTVTHSRSSQLISTDSITSQQIKILDPDIGDLIVPKGDTFATEDRLQLFRELSRLPAIAVRDPLVNLAPLEFTEVRASAFSNDRFLFAAALDGGSVIVFRALTRADGAIAGYEQLAFGHAPAAIARSAPVAACAVSSHLFVACVAVGAAALLFHVSSGRFVREIAFPGALRFVLLNATYQIVFGIGDDFIEVFTVNGTRVAGAAVEERVTAASLSVNDVSVFLATGDAHGVTLWEVDPAARAVFRRKALAVKGAVLLVDVVSEGSALVVITAGRRGTVFCARGIQQTLFKAAAAVGCAGCGGAGQLTACTSCGLYFCGKCCQRSRGKAICSACLTHIEEYATIIEI
jgi:hypothetical protein